MRIEYPVSWEHANQIKEAARRAVIQGKTLSDCPYRRHSNKADIWENRFIAFSHVRLLIERPT